MEQKLIDRKHTVFFIDLLELNLPLLDRIYKEMDNPPQKLKDHQKKIKDADGYLAVTSQYNHSTSAAMKNILDYFLEEYFFKPSSIVSYSAGGFGRVNAAQHLRNIFVEFGAPSIPSSFPISKVNDVFDDKGELVQKEYDKRIVRFLDEFEWYINGLKNQRQKGLLTRYENQDQPPLRSAFINSSCSLMV
jgi:NAD(P)H-dependent FMN reductase